MMNTKIIHLYIKPRSHTSSYTKLKNFISILKQESIVDSKFAIIDDDIHKKLPDSKFKNELISTHDFLKNKYNVLIIEGTPQPQSDFSKIEASTVKEFFSKGGIILHTIGNGDLNSNNLSKINQFLEALDLGLGIDTYMNENDEIIGFDRKHHFRSLKEFIINIDKKYQFNTSYHQIFNDIDKIAVSDPFHQKTNLVCRDLLHGNPTTQVVSREDLIVDNRILTFGKVNEMGGFYVLITGYLFEDYLVDFIENDNLKFGINVLNYFIKEQDERNKELEININYSNYDGANDAILKKYNEFKYDIAFSFAGEDRSIVEEIAGDLVKSSISVFYDEYEKSNLWGKRLDCYFKETYATNTRYVVPFISKHYPKKDWTNFEFSVAAAEAKKRDSEFILPIRIDNTSIVGIPDSIGYLDYNKEGKDGIVKEIQSKLEK
ncbi:TIR domain-containing protein [Methanolobus sp. WCC4]|uniref:TIR domain-containing protein n=1 Tax=Methanolobus sp. WCC4 TaxID=3125784 RepID=UPI0030FB5F56